MRYEITPSFLPLERKCCREVEAVLQDDTAVYVIGTPCSSVLDDGVWNGTTQQSHGIMAFLVKVCLADFETAVCPLTAGGARWPQGPSYSDHSTNPVMDRYSALRPGRR